MSLRAQLAELHQQRDRELRTLHLTYVRSKRDLKRALSPDRMVRRHIGASLAFATLAGFLLAPRPASAAPRAAARPSRAAKSSLVGRLQNLLATYLPHLAGFIPGLRPTAHQPQAHDAPRPGAAVPPGPSLPRLLFKLAFTILGNSQLRRILMQAIRNRNAGPSPSGNGHEPEPAGRPSPASQVDPFRSGLEDRE